MNHSYRKDRLVAIRERKNIEVVGMAGEQCDGGTDDGGFKN